MSISCLWSKMVLGHKGSTTTRVLKWPAVAVVAAASSFYTLEYTKNWWNNVADHVGTTLHALDNTDSSDRKDSTPWWKRVLGKYKPEETPGLPVEIMRKILERDQFCKQIRQGIIQRFETNHLAANSPIEDRHVECFFPNSESMLFGIFDGHSGYHCSETLKRRMPQYLSTALSMLRGKAGDSVINNYEQLGNLNEDLSSVNLPTNFREKQKRLGTGLNFFSKQISQNNTGRTLEDILKLAFVTLDNDICQEAIPDGVADESLLVGLAGSCALASVIEGNNLYVANTGDCRAVIGKRNAAGQWKAYQITNDQTVENAHEVSRIYQQHPNEEKTAIQRDRLLGQLQPLRSFGDVQYKWSRELHENVLRVVYGRPVVPMQYYVTPPYLTAEPVVTHCKITNEDKFVILATDGLWEKVSNDHAVKLIGRGLDRLKQDGAQQENGATKLIRYALGQGSDTHLANMLSLPDNLKRHFHDDITVTVVYFDNNNIKSKL